MSICTILSMAAAAGEILRPHLVDEFAGQTPAGVPADDVAEPARQEPFVTTQSTSLRPGLRLASQVCSTEIIVVRSGTQPLTLLCGGVPMQERGAAGTSKVSRDDGQMRGSLLGQRYTHPEDPAFEVPVTAVGDGTLSADGKELVLKEAKPLPASDLRPTPTSAWRDSVRRQRGSAVSEGPLR